MRRSIESAYRLLVLTAPCRSQSVRPRHYRVGLQTDEPALGAAPVHVAPSSVIEMRSTGQVGDAMLSYMLSPWPGARVSAMAQLPPIDRSYGSLLRLMIMEINKQSEWGVATGTDLLEGSGNSWTLAESLAVHAASVGAFLDTLKSRRIALERAFPERGEILRYLVGVTYDFSEIMEIRNGLVHIDERLEERWQQLAAEDASTLAVRLARDLNDREVDRMFNLDERAMKIAFRKRDGAGYATVDVRELVAALRDIQDQTALLFMWFIAGAPSPDRTE
jgi:hypothetical protein